MEIFRKDNTSHRIRTHQGIKLENESSHLTILRFTSMSENSILDVYSFDAFDFSHLLIYTLDQIIHPNILRRM